MTSTTITARSNRITLSVVAVTAVATFAIIALSVSMGRDGAQAYHTPRIALLIHLLTVIPAVPLGGYVLFAGKGGTTHMMLGRIWGLMMITAITSFWIRGTTGSIGPIHIFSVITLISIPLGVYHIRRGNVAAHRRAMMNTYIGLCVAGIFSAMPGRMIGALIFG